MKQDIEIFKGWLAMLANMAYDIRKYWTPNNNLDKAMPHIERVCKYIRKEIEKISDKN